MQSLSLESRRDSWDYVRIDPDAVECSRAQAAALVAGGPQALEDLVADANAHGAECMYILPEHRRAAVRALFGNEAARASLQPQP